MRASHVALFLAITFGWSWGFWALPVLAHHGHDLPKVLANLAASGTPAPWGPLIGAVAVALLHGGPRGVLDLLRMGLRFRIGWRWWLIVLMLFPALIGGALLAGSLAGSRIAPSEAMSNPAMIPVAFIVILFLGGPLQEEFGWRGTLLDPMQDRFGALGASLVVGTVWALWHLPLFHFPNEAGPYYGRPFWGLFASVLMISVLFTWVWNHTGRSVLAVLVFHTMFNLSHWMFPVIGADTPALILLAAQAVVVVAVVLRDGAARLRL
jgi:uncharacterized protein